VDLWWTETQTPSLRLGLRCSRVIARARSAYQEVVVLETEQFGRLLALDDMVMTTEGDEFVYHEMLTHPAMVACPHPRRVLVVGGGDGGAVREVLRHPTVERVVLAELDPLVVELCRRHLPSVAAGLSDPRVELALGDGARYLGAAPSGAFDVILVDAPDPLGPAEVLFGEALFREAARVLAPGGVLVLQSESPFLHGALIRRIQADLRRHFPGVWLYWAVVPTYPGSMWTFSLASTGPDPLAEGVPERGAALGTRYWSPAVHRAAFALPPFVQGLLAAEPAAPVAATDGEVRR
jgi:spermidine synthase